MRTATVQSRSTRLQRCSAIATVSSWPSVRPQQRKDNSCLQRLSMAVRVSVSSHAGKQAVDEVQEMFKKRAGMPCCMPSFFLLWRPSFSRALYVASVLPPFSSLSLVNCRFPCLLCAEPLGVDGAVRFREMTYSDFLVSMASLVT